MRTKLWREKRKSRNPFSKNFKSRFYVRVHNMTGEDNTSNIEKKRYSIYG